MFTSTNGSICNETNQAEKVKEMAADIGITNVETFTRKNEV